MPTSRFNMLGSLFINRHSRRDAIKYAGVGLGATAIGASVVNLTAAQEASPEPPPEENLGLPEGERTYTMFVQTAQAGTWQPKAGEDGVYTLTLSGLPAQTVYFSDRPERIVGTQTTSEFLSALGFSDENPPNAALVTKAEDGGDDILVIELYNPVYTEGADASGATLVYDARILENYHETGLGRVALEQDDTAIPASFDGASLFIDDCQDGIVHCFTTKTTFVEKRYGCCYSFPACYACSDNTHICDDVCRDGCYGIEYYSNCLY